MPAAITGLVERLRAAQVRVWIEGGQLRYEAPTGALSAELLAEMRTLREELLAFLRSAQAGAGQGSSQVPRASRD